MNAANPADHSNASGGHADEALLTVSQAARLSGVSRSTLYRGIRQGKLRAVTLEDGSRGLPLSQVLAVYGENKAEPIGDKTHPTLTAAPTDSTRISQLEEALRAEKAKVDLLEGQLAAFQEDAGAPRPQAITYSSRRRRWKILRSMGRAIKVLAGSTVIVVVLLILIVALIFSFGGFTTTPSFPDF